MCLNGDYGRCFTFAFVFVAKCSGDSRDVVRRSNEGGQELLFLFGRFLLLAELFECQHTYFCFN